MRDSILIMEQENMSASKDYLSECKKAMEWLGRRKDTFFMGQTCQYKGSPMYGSIESIPMEKRLEYLKNNPDEAADAFGHCDTYENE